MLPLIGRLVAVLRGSTSLATLGSREALIRVSTIGVKSAFTRGSVTRAVGLASKYASNLKKMDFETITSTVEVLATLYLVASEIFPDSDDRENEARVAKFGTSDSLLNYAIVAHNWALSDEGKDKAEEAFDALSDVFTEVESSDMQAILNLLVGPHLGRLRSEGFLFNLPVVTERRFWWDSIQRSDDGVDTAGLTSAETLFFAKVILGFLGTDGAIFNEDDQRMWAQPSYAMSGAQSAGVRATRAMIDRHFSGAQSTTLNMLLDVAEEG